MLKSNGDRTFEYSSPHWTDSTTVLNPTSHPSQAGNAKYPAFNTVQFDAVMGCAGSLANCLEPYAFSSPIENSVALFGGEYRREGIPSQKEFLRMFGAEGQKKCRPQRPGFNTQCADGNHARWGYCANIPSQDCQDADGDDADGVIVRALPDLAVSLHRIGQCDNSHAALPSYRALELRGKTVAQWELAGRTIVSMHL